MVEHTPTSVLEWGLGIAQKLQNEVLFGNNSSEKNLHGFLTVAELLNRPDDVTWVKRELLGYAGDDPVPDYRMRSCTLNDESGNDVIFKDATPFSITEAWYPQSQIEHMMNDPDMKTLKFTVNAKYTKKLFQNDLKDEPSGNYVIKYTKSEVQKILAGAKLELISRLNSMIVEISYGRIPKSIFEKFQNDVNSTLGDSNDAAISELNIAIENLGQSEDQERIAHVAFACRRLIKSIADNLFPPQNNEYPLKGGKMIDVGEEKFLNRLEAFVDSVDSPNRKYLIRKIGLLRDLYGEVPESINKGTHLHISNSDAEMLVIYSYIILGDIVLESKSSKKE